MSRSGNPGEVSLESIRLEEGRSGAVVNSLSGFPSWLACDWEQWRVGEGGWGGITGWGWGGRLCVLQEKNGEKKAYEKMRMFYTMEGGREGVLKLAVRSSTCGSQNSQALRAQGTTR